MDVMQELVRLHAKASGPAQARLAKDMVLVAAPTLQQSPLAAELLKGANPTPVELMKALRTVEEQPGNHAQLASLLFPTGDLTPMWQRLAPTYPAMVSLASALTALDMPAPDRTTIAQTALGKADGTPSEVAAALLTALRNQEPSLVKVQKHLLETFSTPATQLAILAAEGASTSAQRAFYEAALASPAAETAQDLAGVLQGGLGRVPRVEEAPVAAVWRLAGEFLPEFAPKAQGLVDLAKQDTLRLRLTHALLGAVDLDPNEVALLVLGQAETFPLEERHEAVAIEQAIKLRQSSKHTGISEQAGRLVVGGTILRRRT
jgi:hypothetical protein